RPRAFAQRNRNHFESRWRTGMNESMDPHAPTPEFRSSLKRDLLRASRADRHFGPMPRPKSSRIGLAVGLAMGAIITLPIGLVLGARTGYASAAMLEARERDSAERTMVAQRQVAVMRRDLARLDYEGIRREVEA